MFKRRNLYNVNGTGRHPVVDEIGTTTPVIVNNDTKHPVIIATTAPTSSIPPPVMPSHKQVEKLICQEMNALSIEEREQVYYDIHGIKTSKCNNNKNVSSMGKKNEDAEKFENLVNDPARNDTAGSMISTNSDAVNNCESTEFLTEKLNEMQHVIDTIIPTKHKNGYELAVSIDKEYVYDKDFRLMFLRTDDYNPIEASWRLVRFFDMKLELFGRHLLCQDIHQDDLHPTTLDIIYGGSVQILPIRDTAGRYVAGLFLSKQPKEEIDNIHEHLLTRNFYMAMLYAKDLEAQLNGRVMVVFPVPQKYLTPAAVWRAAYFNGCCAPIKIHALHLCIDANKSENASYIMAATATSVDRMSRLRVRMHVSSLTELQYTLMTYGIPVQALPIDSKNGHVLTDVHCAMLKRRRMEERQERLTMKIPYPLSENNVESESIIEYPNYSDVLVTVTETEATEWHRFWAGNQTVQKLIQEHKNRPSLAFDDMMIAAVASSIVQIVRKAGGRFLQDESSNQTASPNSDVEASLNLKKYNGNETLWLELNDSQAHEKVIEWFQASTIETKRHVPERETAMSKLIGGADHIGNDVISGTKNHTEGLSQPVPPSVQVMKTIPIPSNTDVLLGKGKKCQNHTGNLRFRFLVDEYRNEYDAAVSNEERKEINMQILNVIRTQYKGRFLQEIKDPQIGATAGWIEVDDIKAREKISNCFRSKRRVAKKDSEASIPDLTGIQQQSNSNKRSSPIDTDLECRCNPFSR